MSSKRTALLIGKLGFCVVSAILYLDTIQFSLCVFKNSLPTWLQACRRTSLHLPIIKKAGGVLLLIAP